jgi:drug/metabolite transporter (DMT)-like permease
MDSSVSPSPPWKIHLALTIVSVCFGAFSVVGKIALNDPRVSPLALTELRLLSAAIAFLVFAALRREAWPAAKRWLPLAGLALLGTVINQALFLSGLRHTTATEATLLVGSIPLFTFTAGWALGRERSNGGKWLGLALALGGIALLLAARGFSFAALASGDHLLGDGMILINCLSYSFYLVAARPLLRELPSVRAMGVIFLLGALEFAPLGGWPLATIPWRDLPTATLAALAFVVIFPTIIAYFLNLWALKRASPSLVAIYVLMQPLVTTTLALLPPLSERPGWGVFLPGLLIISGVVVFSKKS